VIAKLEAPTGVVLVVLIVSVEVPLPPVIGEGAKEQVTPVGSRAGHARTTFRLKPLIGVTVIVEVVLLPGVVATGAEDDIAKSCTARLILVVCVKLPEVAVMVIVELPAGVEAGISIVSIDVPDPPGTNEGKNEQLTPVGSPAEQVRATSPVKLLVEVMVTMERGRLPGVVVTGEVAEIPKSGAA